ncbi:MAG: AAA family ATPase [Candidatus Poribacteria bacterium]|nr:AAA family ATPase [Candidatus Poribacteria bacterium]
MRRGKGEGKTKIAIKGFKSIAEECEIDIRPLTILAGANSSGKSSIMQPLLMLKQTLEAPYDPGPLLIDGPNVQFTETAQFLSTVIGEKGTDRFQLRIETHVHDFSRSVATTYRKGENRIELIEMTAEEKVRNNQTLSSECLTLYPEMTSAEIKSVIEGLSIPKDLDTVKRFRCFLVLGFKDGYTFFTITPDFESNILNSIHLPGLRGNPERIYKLISTGPRYLGTFENYVASIIHEWQEAKDERLKTVVRAPHILGLTGQVGTKQIGDVGIEVQVGRLPRGSTDHTDMVNIADVGLGVSQVLPVLVALIVAEPGQLVYLEQPELHLHPRAQVALAQVLADAAKRGVRVVAETHSSLLLLGVQTLVAEGDLPPELVKLHWFTRRADGVTEVNSADLDEAGAYGEWPEDFADVDLTIQSRYLDAVDRLHFGKEEAS